MGYYKKGGKIDEFAEKDSAKDNFTCLTAVKLPTSPLEFQAAE